MNGLETTESRNTEQEEVEIVADDSDVTQGLVTVLTDVDKIIFRVYLMPVALELEINGSPCSIAISDSNTIFNSNFRITRNMRNLVNHGHIVVVRDKNVGRSGIKNSVLGSLRECESICDISKSLGIQMLSPEKVIQKRNS